jgi:hypothetical protein
LPSTDTEKESATAIRIRADIPAKSKGKGLVLTLRGYGNANGDLYCNNFMTQFGEALDERSNTVCVEVKSPGISGLV